MLVCVLGWVAAAQLLRTPTAVPKHEKLEGMVKNLAAQAGAGSNATVEDRMTYTLQTLEKVQQETIASRKSKGQEDPLTDEMFNPVIDQVRGIVRGNVKDTVDGLANQALATVKKLEKCSTDLSFDATSESSGYNAAKNGLESAKDSSEEECEDVTTGEDARDNAGKTLYENVKNSVGCSQTAHVDDVPMDALNFPLKNINTWAQTVITQHKEWLDAANKVVTTKGDCSEDKLDTAESCSTLEHLAAKGKQAYEACYNKALGEYKGAVAALVSASQATMRPQIDMVESLICYIRVAIREWDNPQSACTTTEDGKLSCRCDSDQGEVYSNILYDFGVHLGPYDLEAPEKDTSWDDKGCDEAEAAACTPVWMDPNKNPCKTLSECLVDMCWRTAPEVEAMSEDDQRNTVIVELNKKGLGSISHLQGWTNAQLAQAADTPTRLDECLITNGWKSAEQMEGWSGDDQRNTVIVELNNAGFGSISYLQGNSNGDLVKQCARYVKLGHVLVSNSWRSLDDIRSMSIEDRRNTVITELNNKGLGSVSQLQGMGMDELASAGAYTESKPMVGFALVPSEAMPAGYRAVTLDELNSKKADFIKQYNEQGLNVPVKFVSHNCCIMLESKLKMTVNCNGNCGYVYPGLNGQMLCNPSSGYEPAMNYKFGYGISDPLPEDSVFREINHCADRNNPMLALPA
jgi:hypothetical protein